MILTQDEFQEIFNTIAPYNLLSKNMQGYNITTPLREAHFLAQAGYESLNFTRMVEFMGYSPQRAAAVFKSKFRSTAEAAKYTTSPELLANYVYANRFGNGDVQSGDGWLYRGRGFIPITFHDNYLVVGMLLKVNLLKKPEILESLPYAVCSACAWWQYKKLNLIADEGALVVQKITKAINGALQDLAPRKRLFDKIYQKIGKKED